MLVDGVDVRASWTPTLLHRLIGLVPQTSYLFTGTIASNLRYGNADATDDELWQALRIAQAEDFVAALAEGLAAPVAQGGTNFSGGQRQRLAIARALVRRPEIYLFDDSFSALDLATDARLRAALRPLTAGRGGGRGGPAGLHHRRRRPDRGARRRRGRRRSAPTRSCWTAARRTPRSWSRSRPAEAVGMSQPTAPPSRPTAHAAGRPAR